VFHLAMSIAMIAMVWTGSSPVGDGVQLVVFGGYGLYYLVRLVTGRARAALHLLAGLAMVWMVATMPLLMAPGQVSDGVGVHAGHGGAAAGSTAAAAGWIVVTSVALVVALVIAAAWSASHSLHIGAVDRTGKPGVVSALPLLLDKRNDAICNAVMSTGMAAMLMAML
jgi:Domain of unknown function (DUF5134)